MIQDLLWHELEVVKAFFVRALALSTTESASESAALVGASEEVIEHTVLHPRGSYNFEQIVIRSVFNELNALCEFTLQNVWRTVTHEEQLPNNEFVVGASRGAIERALKSRGVDVLTWPRWSDVNKIKELSEGFKHRQRMQPFPPELQKPGLKQRSIRSIDPGNTDFVAVYELGPADAAKSISAVEELLTWLRDRNAL